MTPDAAGNVLAFSTIPATNNLNFSSVEILTDRTIAEPNQLRRALANLRVDGIAVEREKFEEEVSPLLIA